MIRKSSIDDINDLKSLYKICFSDDDNYINFYYNNCFSPENCLVYIKDNKIVSSLFNIYIDFYFYNKKYNGQYIYAACTHPDYRSKGIMSDLINYSYSDKMDNKIDVSILVPQEESLFKFYSKLGYKKFFYINELCFNKKDLIINNDIVISNMSKEKFIISRKEYLNNFNITINYKDDKILNYIYDEILFTNGVIYSIYINGKNKYALCYSLDDYLFIKETSLTIDELSKCLYKISCNFNNDKIIVRSFANNNSYKPFAMCKLISDEIDLPCYFDNIFPYINLMLD